MKEETQQLELKANTEQMALQRVKLAEEERRKTAEYETELAKRRAEH